jgi:hypothetical protein
MMVKEISLTQGKVALVDDEDYEYLKIFSWYYQPAKHLEYANNKQNGLMHRTICFVGMDIDFKEGDVVDHVNGNGLDNRRSNLRVVTQRQNTQNKHVFLTSKYPGVWWDKTYKKWTSQISVNGKRFFLGSHKTEEAAFNAYKQAVHELTGELLVCELGSSSDDGSGDALKSPLLTKKGKIKGE